MNGFDATKRREMSFDKTHASYGPDPGGEPERPCPDTAKWGEVPDTATWSDQEKREWMRFQFDLEDNPALDTEPGAKKDLEDSMLKNFKAFAVMKGDLGKTDLMKFSIKLQDGNVKPHKARGRCSIQPRKMC